MLATASFSFPYLPHKAAITTPPATTPSAPIHTPVGAAPAFEELVLPLPELDPVAAPAPLVPVVFAAVVLPPSVELVLITLNAPVALPVMAPLPSAPVGV